MATNIMTHLAEQQGDRTGGSMPTASPPQTMRPTPRRTPGSAAQRRTLHTGQEYQIARGLGWFSIGLGLGELLAPRVVAKIVGIRGNPSGLIRALGVRELGHGLGILGQSKPASGVWSRVAGDALDLALLGIAFMTPGSHKGRVALTTLLIAGTTALDATCAQQLTKSNVKRDRRAIPVKKSVTINRPQEEVYRYWHDFQNLPRFMSHLEAVQVTGEGRSHWTAKAPAGKRVEWDAVITQDVPSELIAWRSLAGADVENAGIVQFEPAPKRDGTIVRVQIEYAPPGGALGASVAKLFGQEPSQQVEGDLRRFKQVMETGEVVKSEGTLYGNSLLAQRAAQPAANGKNARL